MSRLEKCTWAGTGTRQQGTSATGWGGMSPPLLQPLERDLPRWPVGPAGGFMAAGRGLMPWPQWDAGAVLLTRAVPWAVGAGVWGLSNCLIVHQRGLVPRWKYPSSVVKRAPSSRACVKADCFGWGPFVIELALVRTVRPAHRPVAAPGAASPRGRAAVPCSTCPRDNTAPG